LKEVGDSAFFRSQIKAIWILSNVERIEAYCFCGCKSLCEVVFESDSKLKEIGDFAFFGSSIKTIQIQALGQMWAMLWRIPQLY
jgi:hypothetical protein